MVESRLDRFKRTHQVGVIIMLNNRRGEYGSIGTFGEFDLTNRVGITLNGVNGRRRYNLRLAQDFRSEFCSNCVLKDNEGLQCTQMQNPGKVTRTDGLVAYRGRPDAEIKSMINLPAVYWITLADRLPCKPQVAV